MIFYSSNKISLSVSKLRKWNWF